MNNKFYICEIDDISETGSRGFNIDIDGELLQGFVVHKDGAYFAYRNSCPHTGAPLDWVDHQFVDLDGQLIQCAGHDARFKIESGFCVSGPCAGEKLQKLGIIQQHNALYLSELF